MEKSTHDRDRTRCHIHTWLGINAGGTHTIHRLDGIDHRCNICGGEAGFEPTTRHLRSYPQYRHLAK